MSNITRVLLCCITLITTSTTWAENSGSSQFKLARSFDKSLTDLHWRKVRPASQSQIINQLKQRKEFDVLVSYKADQSFSSMQSGNTLTPKDEQSIKAQIAQANTHRVHGLKKAWAQNNVEFIESYKYLPVVKLRVKPGAKLAQLLAPEEVVDFRPVEYLQLALAQSGPLISQPSAFTGGLDGEGVGIAVVDTGVDYFNSVFACTAPGQPSGCQIAAVYEAASEDNQLDSAGHGTLVAAIAASIAPSAQLLSIDAYSTEGIATSDILDAIDWIIDNKQQFNIRVANFSLGSTETFAGDCDDDPFDFSFDPMYHAFAALKNAGVLPVVASGNSGAANEISVPACYSHTFSVGASYDQSLSLAYEACTDVGAQVDQVACFSNTSEMLDILAPGTLISAAGLSRAGTSMATPHVSAAAALALQVDPSLSLSALQSRLKNSNVYVFDSKSNSNPPEGFPRLDLTMALKPKNDDFDNAISLSSLSSVNASSIFSSSEQGEPLAEGGSTWYRFDSSEEVLRRVKFESDVSQRVYIYSGSSMESLNFLSTVEAGDEITLRFYANNSYYFQISAEDVGGAFLLELEDATWAGADEQIPMLPAWAWLIFSTLPLWLWRRHAL